jgi:hypothetical protein
MVVDFFKEIGVKQGTSRLFVGGVHGKEGLSTINAIETVKNINLSEGNLILRNFHPSPYLSTLDPLYYMSLAGGKLLDLIKKNKPEIYLELHCYHSDKKLKLTRKDRKDIFGVPGLVELENGVLIGSVSPLIRSTFFDLHDFPFTLEMPCDPPTESVEICQKIMEIAAKSINRSQIMEDMDKIYPKQTKRLNDYFKDFSTNFWPAFQDVKLKAQKMDLNHYDELDNLINDLTYQGGYVLNSVQIKQLSEAYMVLREYL